MNPKSRTVIFDLGRVLVDFDNTKTCRALAEFCSHSAEEISVHLFGSSETKKTEKLVRLELGFLTAGEFYDWVVEILNTPQLLYADFIRIWGDIFSPNPGIEKLLARLKRGVSIFVLSNTDWIRWRFIERLPVMRRFFFQREQLILSFSLHTKKPDKQMFLEGIKRSGVHPQKIVYVDDIPEYITAFENLGVRGIVYNCQTDPIEVLESRLQELGIIV